MKDRLLYPCNCSGSGDDGVNVKCNNTNIASLSVGLRQVTQLFSMISTMLRNTIFVTKSKKVFPNYRFAH